MDEGTQAFYGGVEPVEFGDLTSVREQRTVIPATRGVLVKIRRAESKVNEANTYRQISLQLQLVDGLVDGKYKGKVVFARLCYYADPNAYTKDFFKNKQHLVQLKYLLRAVGTDKKVVDGHLLEELEAANPILCDITIKKRQRLVDDGEGGQVSVEELENEVRNFKSAGASAGV